MRFALTLILTAACAGAASAADPGEALDLSRLRVELDRIWMSRLLWYEHGDPASASAAERMEVLLSLRYEGTHLVSAAPAPICSSALTDTGEQLAATEEEQRRMQRLVGDPYRGFRFVSESKHLLPLQLSLRHPSAAAKRLASLEGSMVVICETTAGQTMTVGPAAERVGRTQPVPGCPEGLTIRALAPLTIEVDNGVLSPAHVVELSLRDGTGKELLAPRSDTVDGHLTRLVYRELALPPDGSVQLRLTGPTESVTVPFSLHDIPLDGPPRPVEQGALPRRPAAGAREGGS
jgi:hypothetical protein